MICLLGALTLLFIDNMDISSQEICGYNQIMAWGLVHFKANREWMFEDHILSLKNNNKRNIKTHIKSSSIPLQYSAGLFIFKGVF